MFPADEYAQVSRLSLLVLVGLLTVSGVAGAFVIEAGPTANVLPLQQQADARTPSTPCLADETLVAKYEWTETDGEFHFALDQGSDVVDFTVDAKDPDTPSEGPVDVDWTSSESLDVVVVQAGGGSAPEEVIEYPSPTTSGTVTTDRGISFLAFCRETGTATETSGTDAPETETQTPTDTSTPTETPTQTETPTDTSTPTETPTGTPTPEPEVQFYQVDLVVGGPIENLGERLYSDEKRLVRYLHGTTEDPVRSEGRTYSLADEYEACFSSHDVTADGETATATFTLNSGCSLTVTLASYSKPGPGWDRETADEQELIDYRTRELDSGTYSFTVSVTQSTAGAPTSASVVPLALLCLLVTGTASKRVRDRVDR